jgi:hypothetical protein
MQQDQVLADLERYKGELDGIISRFTKTRTRNDITQP